MTTFDKNMIWKRTVEKNIQNKHLIQERKLLQECFFEPQISKTTFVRQEDKQSRKRNDNMYNKSQEWKLRIETRKRQKEIEIEEKRIKDSTMFITRANSTSLFNTSKSRTNLQIDQYRGARILEKLSQNKKEMKHEIESMGNLICSLREALVENQRMSLPSKVEQSEKRSFADSQHKQTINESAEHTSEIDFNDRYNNLLDKINYDPDK